MEEAVYCQAEQGPTTCSKRPQQSRKNGVVGGSKIIHNLLSPLSTNKSDVDTVWSQTKQAVVMNGVYLCLLILGHL